MASNRPSRLLLVDGPNYYFRAYHAINANMTGPAGQPTNALFGFTRMLLQMLKKHHPEHIVYVFDPKGGTFRDKMFPQYKAHRSEMPEDLRAQLPLIHEMLDTAGVPRIVCDGFEADDVIGTLAMRHKEDYDEIWIVSGDKDLMQIVGGNIFQYEGMKDKLYARDDVYEKWHVWPEQIADLLGIMGDASDNIPGIPGIGKKGAADLLNTYGNLESILEHMDEFKGKRRENLENFAQQGRDGKLLATLVLDVPVEEHVGQFTPDFAPMDRQGWLDFCASVGFGRLAQDMLEQRGANGLLQGAGEAADAREPARETAPVPQGGMPSGSLFAESPSHVPPSDFKWDWKIADVSAATEFLTQTQGAVSFDLETSSLDPLEAEILGIAFSNRDLASVYLPLESGSVPDVIQEWLADPACPKIGQNLKYDVGVLLARGIDVQGVAGDSFLAHVMTSHGRRSHKLDDIAQEYLGHSMIGFDEVTGGTADFRTVQPDKAAEYATEDAAVVSALLPVLEEEIAASGQDTVYREIEVPLEKVIAGMQLKGIKLDTAQLRTMSRELDGMLLKLTAQIEDLAGGAFNLNSTQQLSEILFERLGLPTKGVSRTKAGVYSTRAEVLEKMRDEHPIVPLMLEYRKIEKLRNTYVEPLPQMVHRLTGRIHTSYHQIGAATGRMSSNDPNLQNIPIRDPLGQRIRKAFVPESGYKLVAADYSQIELRVFAHLTEDPGLIDAFEAGEDIHARTASQMFGIPLQEVSSADRRKAKAINFGLLYGMGARRLAQQIETTQHEAKELIEQYFAQFPKVKEGMDQIIAGARECGYVSTLDGRRRWLPDILGSRPAAVAGAERMALNTPVQGSAADIIKRAMLAVDAMLRESFSDCSLLLQVHDELVLEVPETRVDALTAALKGCMESVVELRVPLVVDIGVGDDWDQAH